FADDMLITVSGHSSKRGWAELALKRLREHLEPLGVELNLEKTQTVNARRGEAFAFLGFDLRRVRNRSNTGYFILMTPRKKACISVKARIREVIHNGGAKSAKEIVQQINAILAGWVNYFRVG
ncbi:group II intron maturase-specific domain-containing protein, partial [Paenibacillus popilliae]|uniref:group II intron maturase-specific domain-containing protein n=1 Tax=Paenibacillus popilliae TaxID=78057 RepID=UPI00272ECF03